MHRVDHPGVAADVGDVARRLSRWYGVDVRVTDRSLAAEPFSMTLHGDETVDQVLRVVATAMAARVERRGATYLLVRPSAGDR